MGDRRGLLGKKGTRSTMRTLGTLGRSRYLRTPEHTQAQLLQSVEDHEEGRGETQHTTGQGRTPAELLGKQVSTSTALGPVAKGGWTDQPEKGLDQAAGALMNGGNRVCGLLLLADAEGLQQAFPLTG